MNGLTQIGTFAVQQLLLQRIELDAQVVRDIRGRHKQVEIRETACGVDHVDTRQLRLYGGREFLARAKLFLNRTERPGRRFHRGCATARG